MRTLELTRQLLLGCMRLQLRQLWRTARFGEGLRRGLTSLFKAWLWGRNWERCLVMKDFPSLVIVLGICFWNIASLSVESIILQPTSVCNLNLSKKPSTPTLAHTWTIVESGTHVPWELLTPGTVYVSPRGILHAMRDKTPHTFRTRADIWRPKGWLDHYVRKASFIAPEGASQSSSCDHVTITFFQALSEFSFLSSWLGNGMGKDGSRLCLIFDFFKAAFVLVGRWMDLPANA
jgi:hypothetical protein